MSGQLQPKEERPPTSFTEEWTRELGLGGSTELGQEPRPRWETPGVNCSLIDVLDYSPALLIQFFHDEGLSGPLTLQMPLGVLSFLKAAFLSTPLPFLCLLVSIFTIPYPDYPIGSRCSLSLLISVSSFVLQVALPPSLLVPRRPLAGPPSGIKCP